MLVCTQEGLLAPIGASKAGTAENSITKVQSLNQWHMSKCDLPQMDVNVRL